MISDDSGGSVNVAGSSMAMVATGPIPGSTPISVPSKQPIRQYKRLFELEGIQLTIDDDVLDFMVTKAVEYKLGARGLRSICESILTDAMYELPSQKVKTFNLTIEYAQRKFSISKLSMLKVA